MRRLFVGLCLSFALLVGSAVAPGQTPAAHASGCIDIVCPPTPH